MKTIRYGSVCSGVEAASLAWQPLGWEPAFFAEVEPFPCAVLQQRFNATKPLRPLDPAEAVDEKDRRMREQWLKQINKLPDTGTIPNLGDFTKITKEDYHGNIDLLVGGTPCQDVSVAGKRAGFDGHRSSLALDFVRLAYELGCKWFVWENVPGVFSSDGGGDFAALLSLFTGTEVGIPQQGFLPSGFVCNARRDRFGVAWRVLDAQYTRTPLFPFAVPQRRRRVFVVGYFGDWTRAAEVLFEPGRVSWNPPARIKKREVLAGDTGEGIETASTIRMRAGCNGGGNGALVGNQLSNTLLNGNDQTLVEFAEASAGTLEASYYKGVGATWNERTIVSTKNEQKVFTMDADRSNSMKSPNPQSGFHEADVAKTLDTTVPTPQKAQGGQMVIAYENHANDSRVTDTGDVSPVMTSRMGTGGNNVPLVQAVDTYNASVDDVAPTCRTASASDSSYHHAVAEIVSPTLDASMYQKNQLEDISKYHAVCSALGLARDVLESEKNAKFGLTRIEETQPTLTARGAGGCLTHSTVRRLLPIECERLMGFPDNHTRIAWNGKPEEECPDAPRYKACGNSFCVNVMEWIGRRIEQFK